MSTGWFFRHYQLTRIDVFETWYGELYDSGVQHPLAPLGGALMWGADIQRVFDEMAQGVASERGQVVLDCPTGGGVTFARGLPDSHGLLIAADLSALMLARAAKRRGAIKQRRHIALLRADATRLPLADQSVDRILCFNSLHCIPAHRAVLKEFRRVLKKDGELRGTTLTNDAPFPWRASVIAAQIPGFFHPPDSRRLAAEARAAGFENWSTHRTGALLFFNAA